MSVLDVLILAMLGALPLFLFAGASAGRFVAFLVRRTFQEYSEFFSVCTSMWVGVVVWLALFVCLLKGQRGI